MLTACKQTLISTSKAATGVVGRHQRGESEVVLTIAATRTIPVVDPMQREASAQLYGPASSLAAVAKQ